MKWTPLLFPLYVRGCQGCEKWRKWFKVTPTVFQQSWHRNPSIWLHSTLWKINTIPSISVCWVNKRENDYQLFLTQRPGPTSPSLTASLSALITMFQVVGKALRHSRAKKGAENALKITSSSSMLLKWRPAFLPLENFPTKHDGL